MYKVTLRWGKKKVENVPLNASEDVIRFKQNVFERTGGIRIMFDRSLDNMKTVPVDRQKILCRKSWKGKLENKMTFADMKNLSDKMKISLIGTSEGIPKPPAPGKILFREDMTASQAVSSGIVMRPGLKNLGNTCYLNSTVQCLKAVPELNAALKNFSSAGSSVETNMTIAMKHLFSQLDGSKDAVTPMAFVGSLRRYFPDPFAQRTAMNYKQQDADEFLSCIMSKILTRSLISPVPSEFPSLGGEKSLVDAMFGIRLTVEMKCVGVEGEKVKTRTESAHKLVCNIRGTEVKGAEKVDHLFQGVLAGFEGTVEMNSPVAGRNALWTKTARIDRLPRYLCVNFCRFYWKPTPQSRDHAGINCKIMRKVKFPKNLDAFEFCSDRLKNVLKVPREKYAKELLEEAERKAKAEREQTEKEKGTKKKKSTKKKRKTEEATIARTDDETVSSTAAPDAMDVVEEEEEENNDALAAALKMSMQPATQELAGIGMPPNFRGNYEIFAIVTHKGRSSDGGHYMAYVRENGDDWVNYDDDVVEKCKWEHIEPLAGGGDRDMAYLAFYRMKE